jgi:hypothetical protein
MDHLQVVVVGEDINRGLIEQGGMQAAVPTTALVQSPTSMRFAMNGSVDAVVALGTLTKLSGPDAQKFLMVRMQGSGWVV